jgi:hypothetical protein
MAKELNKDNKMAFLPWSAVNAFMLEDFQLEVIKTVLTGYEHLDSEQRRSLNAQIKRGVKVPGFRNAISAPISIRTKHSIELFEKNAAFAGNVLSAWAKIYSSLAELVHPFLEDRQWKILPLAAEHEKLPGFLTQWPLEDEFEVLTKAFREAYPESEYTDNQISLMCVWLAGRLPYELVAKAEVFTPETDETQE